LSAYLGSLSGMNAHIAMFTDAVALAIGVDQGVGFAIPLALALVSAAAAAACCCVLLAACCCAAAVL
jgi:hypothetical protein